MSARKSDAERQQRKVEAIVKRLSDIRGNENLLIGMLDETKLDLMILSLGLGEVSVGNPDDQ